jgi:copper homeostasis protein
MSRYGQTLFNITKMNKSFQLEVAVYNIESALAASEGGADRIELCSGYAEGGLTPSFAMIEYVKKNVQIPLHVMIRPRSGDFLYSDQEFLVMKKDINACRNIGADAVVFGILLPDGRVDAERCRELVDAAKPMNCTFHRAFDVCCDPLQSLENIISCGFGRILTSGQKPKATDGISLISELNRISGNRIIIMPGSGISELNIAEMVRKTGSFEFHTSAKAVRTSGMEFFRDAIKIGILPALSETVIPVTSAARVKKLKEILQLADKF